MVSQMSLVITLALQQWNMIAPLAKCVFKMEVCIIMKHISNAHSKSVVGHWALLKSLLPKLMLYGKYGTYRVILR